MDGLQLFLGNIWFFLLGLILVLYVVLDGFDLGVGVVSLWARDEAERGIMMSSIGSIWDANETWLVLLGGALFGAFPLVYSALLHALYIPITVMLFGLIFRGVAFEFHDAARRKRVWGVVFGVGSIMAAMAQGVSLGTLIQGIPVSNGDYTGDGLEWLTPFPLLVGVGVSAGYTLLGATYLIVKARDGIQQDCRRYAKVAAAVMLTAAVIVSLWTPWLSAQFHAKWLTSPNIYLMAPLPGAAMFAFFMVWRGLDQGRDRAPFFWSIGVFLCSFVGLAITLYPHMIPPDVTIADAAASPKTLVFMLTGIGMLLPIMLIYNAYQYLVFRGKIGAGGYG